MAGTWTPQQRGTEGCEILENGRIKLTAFRAQALTYNVNIAGPSDPHPGHILLIVPKKIRVTAAIPMDHRLTAALKIAPEKSKLGTGDIKGVDATDVDLSSGMVRQLYTKAGELYKYWVRQKAWNTPESLFDENTNAPTAQLPDKLGNGDGNSLRDDTKYIQAAAQRRLAQHGRIAGEKSVFLKGVVLSHKPGDMIRSIGIAKVNKCVKEVIIHCGDKVQITELILQ